MTQPNLPIQRIKHGPLVYRLVVPATLVSVENDGEIVLRDPRTALEGRGSNETEAREAFTLAFHAAMEQSEPRVNSYGPLRVDTRLLTDHELLTQARFARSALDAVLRKASVVERWHHASVTLRTAEDGCRTVQVTTRIDLKPEEDAAGFASQLQHARHDIEERFDVELDITYGQG